MQVRKSILILVIIAACLAPYFNTLFADFVWDDNIVLMPNPYLKSFRFLPDFFTQDFWKMGRQSFDSGYYRPFLAVSYMLNYTLWGNNPFGYHLVSLIFHIIACILIFVFIELLIKDRLVAFIKSLLFAVHPVHTESVSFICYGLSNISLIFFILSLILFLKYALYNKRLIFYLLSLICYSVSLLTMENAITLILIVIGMDYLFLSQCDIKKVARNFLRLHLGFLITLSLYVTARTYVVGWNFLSVKVADQGLNFSSGTGIFWRPFTVIKLLTYYLRLLFFPYGLKLEYMISPSNSLFDPPVLMGIALLSLLLYAAVRNVKRYPLLSFSIAWFFIAILPVSNIVPVGNIFSERYLYIPSVGFCLGMGFLFSWLRGKDVVMSSLDWKKSLTVLFCLLIIALGRVTYERNKVWYNELTLWQEAVEATPNSWRAHTNLAYAYYNYNILDKAAVEAKKSIELRPNNYLAFVILGRIHIVNGLYNEAIEVLEAHLDISPDKGAFYDVLAAAYGLKGQYEQAIEMGYLALKENPYLDIARYNLALNYLYSGQVDKAIDMYEEYLGINPNHYGVHVDVGHLYYLEGDYQSAKRHWLAALKISKDYQPAREALELLNN